MTRQQAHAYLSEAGRMNPGPWVGHSRHVALAAENIAKQIDMDPELAYTMGLLHDIGRREGVFQLRHGMDGYKYLINEGYPDHARICITHSYTVKDKNNFGHYDDLTAPERRFVTRFLSETEYDDYDRLIQLADFLGLPQRLCTVDERIADVLSRTPDPSPEFLKNVFAKRELDAYFNRKILAGIKR